MVREKLLELLQHALQKEDVSEKSINLQNPVHPTHGDYTTNIALKLAKKLKKDPMTLANGIIQHIQKTGLVERVEAVKPGFINFFISPDALLKNLQVKPAKHIKKAVLVEFGQPNTHKTPHIGHLFSYIFGESLARIFEFHQHRVVRLNWQGDVGPHVAKCLYEVAKNKSKVKDLKTLEDKVNFLQKCYQEGSKLYEKDEKIRKEIDELNVQIYRQHPPAFQLWKETRSWSLDFYKAFEKKLGVRYDKYYFESEGGPVGKKIVQEHLGKVFEESEGAVIFRGEKHGLHTRVFITKNGNPTYEGKEIGLNYFKLRDFFPFDVSMVTTASEQNEFFKVTIKASELVFPKLAGKLHHFGFGLIHLTTGKMSSRTGQIVTAFSLVDTVRERIKVDYKMNPVLSEKIALAAIKYSFLRSDAFRNSTFDIEKSIAKDGDSGPYLLYAYVRIQSILNKEKHIQISSISFPVNPEEKDLLQKLNRFRDVVETATALHRPHFIANYLFTLAQSFNLFYQKHPVLKAEKEVKTFRLNLISSVAETIKKGLYLLGIETVEKM